MKVGKTNRIALNRAIDLCALPAIFISALVLRMYRNFGSCNLPLNTATLKSIGTFPLCRHYYEPLFADSELKHSLRNVRQLPGIDFEVEDQIAFLDNFSHADEFLAFLKCEEQKTSNQSFVLENGMFESGDADYLYQILRFIKPKKIIEIGCGSSTKIIAAALAANKSETCTVCEHICIEPYHQPWLDKFENIHIIRKRVEDCNIDWARELGEGDLLFVDSSHMIRPQGDVLFEYLYILPQLSSGVFVHVHDIFSPRDYLDEWVRDNVLFWNEQYLLEATLGNQARYKVIGALNLLSHDCYDELKSVCPSLTPASEPRSFYFCVR